MSRYTYEKGKAKRNARILAGRCVKSGGCTGTPVTDGGLCERHRAAACRYAREAVLRLRLTVPRKPAGGRREGSGRKRINRAGK